MTDPNSPDIQAIFDQLHALGVTPEQAAAGVRLLSSPLSVGDRVRVARKSLTPDSSGSQLWVSYMDETIGGEGTITRISGTSDIHVSLDSDEEGWVYPQDALDLIEPRKEPTT